METLSAREQRDRDRPPLRALEREGIAATPRCFPDRPLGTPRDPPRVLELLPILEDRARLVPTPLGRLGSDAPVPLAIHCRYRRDDVLSAFGLMTPERPHGIREGVTFDNATKSDLFFVTLQKTEKHYSPTTRYRDYAISPELFHWESQSTTSVASKTGQRYLRHRELSTHILVRARDEARGRPRAAVRVPGPSRLCHPLERTPDRDHLAPANCDAT